MDLPHSKKRSINLVIKFFCIHILSSSLEAHPEVFRTRTDICDSLFSMPHHESINNASTDTVF